jgi:nucleotide-binding universal stress UspA family protein
VERQERTANLREAESLLAGKGVTHRTIEGHGDPADVIVEEANDVSADLIIVGTGGRSAPARSLLGSVSTRVLHLAPCDVLVVR